MRRYGIGVALLAVALSAVLYWRLHPRTERFTSVPEPIKAKLLSTDAVPVDVPSGVVEELAQLRPGITVSQWRLSNPTDEWHKPTYAYDDQVTTIGFGNFCITATVTKPMPMGQNLTRKAVFYLPTPPASMALPNGSPSDLVDSCVLGYVETTLQAASNEAKAALDREISARLASRYGQPSDEPSPVNQQRIIRTWNTGDVKTAVGNLLSKVPTNLFSASSYVPVFRYERMEFPDQVYGSVDPAACCDSVGDSDLFELAMETAAGDEAVAHPMRDMYQKWIEFEHSKAEKFYGEQPSLPRPFSAKEVAAVLGPWLRASTELPPRRRAATLLASEFELDIAWAQFTTTGRKTDQEQSDLESVGAEFTPGYAGFVPSPKWVREARQLDPEGPIGDAIMLLAASGWRLDELYSGEYEGVTDYVIAGAKRYLTRSQNSNLAAWAEFFIASAYCDQVIIGQAGNTDNPDYSPGPELPVPTQSEITRGVAAKPEALRHVKSLLAMDRSSKRAIAAWRMAWRLMAELRLNRHIGINAKDA